MDRSRTYAPRIRDESPQLCHPFRVVKWGACGEAPLPALGRLAEPSHFEVLKEHAAASPQLPFALLGPQNNQLPSVLCVPCLPWLFQHFRH